MIIAVATRAIIERTADLDAVMGASTIVALDNLHQRPGGTSAAVARHLVGLGADVLFMTAAPAGSRLGRLLDAEAIPHHLVPVDRPVTATFSVGSATGPVTAVAGHRFHPAEAEIGALATAVGSRATGGGIVYISGPDAPGSGTGNRTPSFYTETVTAVRQRVDDATIAVDSRDNPGLVEQTWDDAVRPDWLICTADQPYIARAIASELHAAGTATATPHSAATAVAERIALDGCHAAGVILVTADGQAVVASHTQQFTADVAKNTGRSELGINETVARLLNWADS